MIPHNGCYSQLGLDPTLRLPQASLPLAKRAEESPRISGGRRCGRPTNGKEKRGGRAGPKQ